VSAERASRTAQYVALYRALETEVKGRAPLFRDPFAIRFLPLPYRPLVTLSRFGSARRAIEQYADARAPGARTSAIARTRFIDDAVHDALDAGCEQVVILGAGYDCRAHRLPRLRGVPIFEVDRAATQAIKRRLLGRGVARHDVRYVAVDFDHDDFAKRLVQAGFHPERPTVFLWEGVTNYLNDAAVSSVLEATGKMAANSRIVFTYIHRGVLDGSVDFVGAAQLLGNTARLGEPWTFGLLPSELSAYIGRFGLRLEQDLGADDYRALYHLGSPGYAYYRIAVARVQRRA
jgi:methyltransferase (TIGR00027 family)